MLWHHDAHYDHCHTVESSLYDGAIKMCLVCSVKITKVAFYYKLLKDHTNVPWTFFPFHKGSAWQVEWCPASEVGKDEQIHKNL